MGTPCSLSISWTRASFWTDGQQRIRILAYQDETY